ncbi:MAG: hypothetical protein ABFC18_04420 [Rikenellaceae bacterium]|jgi:hypothetical protein|nr:hypothetical protein [Bacteroidales bacterium]
MKKKCIKWLFAALAVIFLNVSCSKDDNPEFIGNKGKVLVINQGNYTEQSASISLYDETTNQITNRLYESANGVSIGATLNSGYITPYGDAALICNYPDKILFINPETGVDKGYSITDGLVSPRNMVMSDSYIYVTNWGSDHIVLPSGSWEFDKSYISVYSISTLALQGNIDAGSDAEGIILYDGRLYVAVKQGLKIFDIVGNTLRLAATLKPTTFVNGARHVVVDGMNKIWVSFPGDGLMRINPSSLEIMSTLDVPVDAMDGYIAIDKDGDYIYTYCTTFDSNYIPVEANIYKVNVKNNSYSKLFTGTYFYGVGVSPVTGNIFTSEVSFTSNSVLKVVAPSDGSIRNSATAGIGTCRYLFF